MPKKQTLKVITSNAWLEDGKINMVLGVKMPDGKEQRVFAVVDNNQ